MAYTIRARLVSGCLSSCPMNRGGTLGKLILFYDLIYPSNQLLSIVPSLILNDWVTINFSFQDTGIEESFLGGSSCDALLRVLWSLGSDTRYQPPSANDVPVVIVIFSLCPSSTTILCISPLSSPSNIKSFHLYHHASHR